MRRAGWLWLLAPPVAGLAWAWAGGALYLTFNGAAAGDATPLTLYQYYVWHGSDPVTLARLKLAAIVAAVLVASPLLLLLPKARPMYGAARWARPADIRKAGLLADTGIVVGRLPAPGGRGRPLIFGGNQHVLLAAPTRAGKGVGVVIPNLLAWPDSVIVLDIKSENWDLTAGFRAAHGQACYRVNLAPRDYRTHRWNPLFYISKDPNFRIDDIQKTGQMLFPRLESESPIWQASARSLWLGLVLLVIDMEFPVTMGEVLRQLSMGDDRLAGLVAGHAARLSGACVLALQEYLDTPEKTRGSVRKTFSAALELFRNPVIDAATAGNDFDLRDLRRQRMSIYLTVTPDDLDRLAPLLNLFFQQALDLNTQTLPSADPTLKHQVLLVMDEFTAMGKVPILGKAIAWIAGYGLRILPVIQSPAQLREVYGAETAETFMENHAVRIVFAPKTIKTAQEISAQLGTTTVKSKSRSMPGGLGMGKSGSGGSVSISAGRRELLLPQEVMAIGADRAILLVENAPPVRARKIRWYEDPVFMHRGGQTPPAVPVIDPAATPHARPVKPDAPERNPERFTAGFPDLQIPEGPLSDADIQSLARQFVDKTMLMNDDDPERNPERFTAGFPDLQIPEGPLSDADIQSLARQFVDKTGIG